MWRGSLPCYPQFMARKGSSSGKTEHLGGVIDSVLGRLIRPEQLAGYRVWPLWEEIVGPVLAERTRPCELRDGVLTVEVNGASWMQELRFLEAEVLERIHARVGTTAIRKLHFVPGSGRVPPRLGAQRFRRPRRPESPSDPIPPIRDARLRALFERIVERHNQRHRERGGRRERDAPAFRGHTR